MKDWTTLTQGQTIWWVPEDTKFPYLPGLTVQATVTGIFEDHAIATAMGASLWIDDDTVNDFGF